MGAFALLFAFVTTYVPQPLTPIPEAEAKGMFGVVFDAIGTVIQKPFGAPVFFADIHGHAFVGF